MVRRTAGLLGIAVASTVGCTNVRVVSAYDGGGEVIVGGPEQNVELEDYLRKRCPANGYTIDFDANLVARTEYTGETVYVDGVMVRQIVEVPVLERHVRYRCNPAYRPG